MRTTLLVVALAGACGGGSKQGPAAVIPAAPGAERPVGTTGFPGLDWGDTDDVHALYADGKTDDAGVHWTGDVDGKPATVDFSIGGDGLSQIDVTWAGDFDSMGACGDVLHELRPTIDRRLGQGAEENLGVFWTTATAEVELACNPDDSGRATMIARYAQKTE